LFLFSLFSSVDNEMVSSLALQMSLYFNTYFFPLWWVSSIMMLQMKVNVCFTTSPWHCYLVSKIKSSSYFLKSQVSLIICEIFVYFCFFSIPSCLITTSSFWSHSQLIFLVSFFLPSLYLHVKQ